MKNFNEIRNIMDQIENLEQDIEYGQRAWHDGDDPCAMADCDPSDWYVKEQEIDSLLKDLKTLVKEIC